MQALSQLSYSPKLVLLGEVYPEPLPVLRRREPDGDAARYAFPTSSAGTSPHSVSRR
jgi:hypothetical protein